MNAHLTFSILALSATLSYGIDESPLERIRREEAPNPASMDRAERERYIQAAREGKTYFLTQDQSMQFLVDAGDQETILEVLKTARDYERFPSARLAWDYFERSTNPDLILLFDDDINLDESPYSTYYANGEYFGPRRSSRASAVMLSIIKNSKAFPQPISDWAGRMTELLKNGDKAGVRASARTFIRVNRDILAERRFSDAVVPGLDGPGQGASSQAAGLTEHEPPLVALPQLHAPVKDALDSPMTAHSGEANLSNGGFAVFGVTTIFIIGAVVVWVRLRKASPPPTPRN